MRKNGNPGICNTMNGPWGHYAKWDKSDRERQILHGIIYMWNLKVKLIKIESRMVVNKSWGIVGNSGIWEILSSSTNL